MAVTNDKIVFFFFCISVHVRVVIAASNYTYSDNDNRDKNSSFDGRRRGSGSVGRGELVNRLSGLVRETFTYLDSCKCDEHKFYDGHPGVTIISDD